MAIDIANLMRDMGAAWISHDTGRIVSFFTDDAVYEDVPLGILNKGKKEIADFIHDYFAGFPDVKVQVTGSFLSADHACGEWIITGTHRGFFPNLPASGRVVSIRGITISEFRGDKISRRSDYYDMAELLRQLGVLPSAP